MVECFQLTKPPWPFCCLQLAKVFHWWQTPKLWFVHVTMGEVSCMNSQIMNHWKTLKQRPKTHLQWISSRQPLIVQPRTQSLLEKTWRRLLPDDHFHDFASSRRNPSGYLCGSRPIRYSCHYQAQSDWLMSTSFPRSLFFSFPGSEGWEEVKHWERDWPNACHDPCSILRYCELMDQRN